MQTSGTELNRILRKRAKLVYSIAYMRTQNHADAEDIFQEVFLKMAQREEPFRSEEHEKAWLIRVTANLSTNLIGSAWRRHVTLREFLPAHRNIPAADEAPSAIDEALRTLREKDRLAVYLRYYEEMSTEEIAEILGTSAAGVRARLNRAKKKLRRRLNEAEKEDNTDVRHEI